jgi:hypothetical protein
MMAAEVAVRAATADSDLERLAEIVNATSPEDPTTPRPGRDGHPGGDDPAGHLTTLETGSDEANAPMRAVNARLGYRPSPDEITMRGPWFGGMMTR